MDTIEPVSTKHLTVTPPVTTSARGQTEINLEAPKFLITACEPVAPPPKLWLYSSVGTSFPTLKQNETETLKLTEAEYERGHANHHTLVQNGQAAYSAYRLQDQERVDD
ncbi:hypothetical protein GOODEAATRI_027587 [Goodea atripinnis]|uniref:Uncharacterized protein n=1 Tax=Goodea atripinnis TaxID=208336 RepID=A0ABV0P897_9TELE